MGVLLKPYTILTANCAPNGEHMALAVLRGHHPAELLASGPLAPTVDHVSASTPEEAVRTALRNLHNTHH